MADLKTMLAALFDADRALLQAEEAFLSGGADHLLAGALDAATTEAFALGGDEAEIRLRRIADLAAQLEGPVAVAVILRVLDHDEPSVRVEAGEALLDVAYERFKEVARGVEHLLETQHTGLSMRELPFVLAEVREPMPTVLLVRFLKHADAEVVAAAVEALAELGDPSAIPHLERVLDDSREVEVEDLEDATASIGDLAADAIVALGGGDDGGPEA
jgi:HEAT repeat protein